MPPKRKKRKVQAAISCTCQRHSLVLGFIGDILFVLNFIAGLVSKPIHAVTKRVFYAWRHHPIFGSSHFHAGVAMAAGVTVVITCTIIEQWSQSVVYQGSIETMRAAGVCPVWETLAVYMGKITKDFT